MVNSGTGGTITWNPMETHPVLVPWCQGARRHGMVRGGSIQLDHRLGAGDPAAKIYCEIVWFVVGLIYGQSMVMDSACQCYINDNMWDQSLVKLDKMNDFLWSLRVRSLFNLSPACNGCRNILPSDAISGWKRSHFLVPTRSWWGLLIDAHG